MPDYSYSSSGRGYAPWDYAGFSTNFHRVVVESGVTYLGDYSFLRSHVETVYIAAASMGDNIFQESPYLREVELAEGVTSIGGSNFRESPNLTKINIPGSVQTIGGYNFYETPGLTSIGPVGSGASIAVHLKIFPSLCG